MFFWREEEGLGGAMTLPSCEEVEGTTTMKRKRGSATGERLRAAKLAQDRKDRIDRAYSHDAASCLSGELGALDGLRIEPGVSWRRLEPSERESVLDLTERNMRDLYGEKWEATTKKEKRRDMASRDARYILVRDPRNDETIVGFANYRFVLEDEWVVLYVYELQVDATQRRKGLGRALLRLSESLAKWTGVEGVMLTTLKRNVGACKFYEAQEYFPSAIDPSLMFPDQADRFHYRILAKLFPPQPKER